MSMEAITYAIEKIEAAYRVLEREETRLQALVADVIARGDLAEIEAVLRLSPPHSIAAELTAAATCQRSGIPARGKRTSIENEPIVGARVCYSDLYLTNVTIDPNKINVTRTGRIVGVKFYAEGGMKKSPNFVSEANEGTTIANVRWDDDRPGHCDDAEATAGHGVNALNLCALPDAA